MTLQERLREAGYTIYLEAADELDRLQAENEALRAILRELRDAHEPVYLVSPEGRAYLQRINTALAAAKEQKP